MSDSRARGLSRREAMNLLGAGAGLGLVTALRQDSGVVVAAAQGSTAKVTFPKGAIIRTVLKDVSPDALGKGATLFHDHLSMSSPRPWAPPPATPVKPQWLENVDAVVEVPGGHRRVARIQVGVEPQIDVSQHLRSTVRDGELEPRDAVVAGQRPGQGSLVHGKPQGQVRFAVGVRGVHGLGLVVGVVCGQQLLRREQEVLIHPTIAIVVTTIQSFFVHATVEVIVLV